MLNAGCCLVYLCVIIQTVGSNKVCEPVVKHCDCPPDICVSSAINGLGSWPIAKNSFKWMSCMCKPSNVIIININWQPLEGADDLNNSGVVTSIPQKEERYLTMLMLSS